jgi:hypothetical protein
MLSTGDGLKILDSADKSVKVSAGDRDNGRLEYLEIWIE